MFAHFLEKQNSCFQILVSTMGLPSFYRWHFWTSSRDTENYLDLTIETILVQVSQRSYGTSKSGKNLEPIQLRSLEVSRGSLQRHCDLAHLLEFPIRATVHEQGCSDKHICITERRECPHAQDQTPPDNISLSFLLHVCECLACMCVCVCLVPFDPRKGS